MKRVLILGNKPETFTELAARLTDDNTKVEVSAYTNLALWLGGDTAKIFDYRTGTDLREYQQILVLSTSPRHERNYIFSAVACYCRKYQIELLDDNFTNTDGKLYAMWKFWEDSVTIPQTAFGPAEFLMEALADLGGVAVLKSVKGTKGKDNYLVHTAEEIAEITAANPEIDFILQNFIPNDGDYRIVTTNFTPQLAIYRSANGKDFRNNTSLGGEASLIPLNQLDPAVLDLASRATKSLNIKIAGADIIQNRETGAYSVLEVNRTPQLATGAFVEEKAAVLKQLI